jgi:hypothetical protein
LNLWRPTGMGRFSPLKGCFRLRGAKGTLGLSRIVALAEKAK